MKFLIFFILIILSTSLFAYPERPNSMFSTGMMCTVDDPDFQKYRYDQMIPYCERNVAWETKAEVLREYNVPLKFRKQYIIDHIIPLSIGGSNSIKNLWPEHNVVKKRLGRIEDDMFEAVKYGTLTQYEAVHIILRAKFGIDYNKVKDIYIPSSLP